MIHADFEEIADKTAIGEISEPIVMYSPAGHYVGSVYLNEDDWFEPYDRLSNYMSEADALYYYRLRNRNGDPKWWGTSKKIS